MLPHVGLRQVGYCTNVHAGRDLAETRAHLRAHAVEVKRRFAPAGPMGVGLWLSAAAARELRAAGRVAEFADWLRAEGLVPFTLNGFPHGDFHQRVVKHAVYHPTWADPARLDYTRDLVDILHELLPAGLEGSVSTLPLAWGRPPCSTEFRSAAARQLTAIADHLADLEQRAGRLVHLCLEPEPGCELDDAGDAARFFEEHLLVGSRADVRRRHLRVCHDICHSAVMFEPQAEALRRYQAAGVLVGKTQVSAAARLRLAQRSPPERQAALAELARLAEERYLHQTCVRRAADAEPLFFEDLPLALEAAGRDAALAAGEWRVHFHVPIYLASFGRVETTQDDILEFLAALRGASSSGVSSSAAAGMNHFEVETYAWGVLPPELKQTTLAAGIADELAWFDARVRGAAS